MKILVITQYYLPEPGATSNRLSAFVEEMVRRGHDVTVICEFPNHPSGKLSRGDKWRFFRMESHGKYRIIRTFVLAFSRKNVAKRILFYLSFSFSSFIVALSLKRHDVILSSSPPSFHAYSALVAAKIKRSIFIVDIRDLLSDAAMEVGAVTNNFLIKVGKNIERQLYLNASKIYTVSEGLKSIVEKRGGAGKTHIIYNGSDEDILFWKGDSQAFRRSVGWEGKIVVAYAGLIGLPQNLVDLLPEIAEVSEDNILFAFIGDGPERDFLKKAAEKTNANNITFLDLMPRSEVIPFIHAADIMMIVLKELDFFRSAIPSKFFDYMAAGKPVITNVDGELRKIMEQNNTGIYFSYRQKGSFASAIKTLAENAKVRMNMGENGKRLVVDRFLRKNLASNAIRIIENTAG